MKPSFKARPSEFRPPVFAKKAVASNRGWVNPDGSLVVPNSGLLDRMNAWEKKANLELTKEIAPELRQPEPEIAPDSEVVISELPPHSETIVEEPEQTTKKKRGGGRKKKQVETE